MARADTDDYRSVFLADTPLMDTRAPAEFTRGALPAAHSLPLMTDDERAQVGTCYKQQGQAAAISLGHKLVTGAVRDARLQQWLAFTREHPQGYLYCWRGGMRSQIVQQWLREAGVDYPRVLGGYKAMRQFLLEELEHGVAQLDFVLIAGRTGSGKTRLLNALPRAVDLEGLARHRGSAFGALLDEQPTQIDFENSLAIHLLRLAAVDNPAGKSKAPVYVEDEGRLIGRLSLPGSLRDKMADAPMVELDHSLEERVEVVLEDYVLDLGARYRVRHGDAAPKVHQERLQGDLARTRKRLGGDRFKQVSELMREAFARQESSGDLDSHRAWITLLLRDYYDPMYDFQISQRKGACFFRGKRQAAAEWALAQAPAAQ